MTDYESFPRDGHNSRAITLFEHEQLAAPLGLSGLIGFSDVEPAFSDGSIRGMILRAGVSATIRGSRFNNNEDLPMACDANTDGLPRYDLLVLRLRRGLSGPGAGDAYSIVPTIIKGTSAANPVVPSPVTNLLEDVNGFWDLPIRRALIPSGATSTTAEQSLNQAWWATGSGYVGYSTAPPPVEAGVLRQDADTGISYVGTLSGSWQRIYHYTGNVNVPGIPAGWVRETFTVARDGNTVSMTFNLRRSGAAVSASFSPTFGPMLDQFKPAASQYGVYHCTSPDHSSHFIVSPSGVVTVGANFTDVIAEGANLYGSASWVAKP